MRVGTNVARCYMEANHNEPTPPVKDLILEAFLNEGCIVLVKRIAREKIGCQYILGGSAISLGMALASRSIIVKNVGCFFGLKLLKPGIIQTLQKLGLDKKDLRFGNHYPEQPLPGFAKTLFNRLKSN